MNITINVSHGGFIRMIDVQALADAGKQLSRVETKYDQFPVGDRQLLPPASRYAESFQKQEGIAPGLDRVVVVTAWHTDGSSDSAQKRWRD